MATKILGNRLAVIPVNNQKECSPIVIPEKFKPKTADAVVVALGTGSDRDKPALAALEEIKVGDRVRIDLSHPGQVLSIDGKPARMISSLDVELIYC